MFLFQESLALARILKDEKREAEILYYLGSIHQYPPLKSIVFAGPVWSGGKMEIAGGVAPDQLAEEIRNLNKEPVAEDLEKALLWYQKALELAEKIGHNTVTLRCLLDMAVVYRTRGDEPKYLARCARLKERHAAMIRNKERIPFALMNEIRKEIPDLPTDAPPDLP